MQKHIRSKIIHKLHLYLLIYLGLFTHTSLNAQRFEDIKQLYYDENPDGLTDPEAIALTNMMEHFTNSNRLKNNNLTRNNVWVIPSSDGLINIHMYIGLNNPTSLPLITDLYGSAWAK